MEQQQTPGTTEARLQALTEFVARVESPRGATGGGVDAVASEVLDAFDAAGIDALLLKGPGVAALLYGRVGARASSDVDLLIAPDQFDAAAETLAERGYVYAGEDDGIDDVGGVVHAQAWVRLGARDQPVIDLHRWLPGSSVTPAAAWEALAGHRSRIEVAGRQAPVPDEPAQAMHLAMHAAQHGRGSQKHVDELALALALLPPDVWDSAALLAAQIGATEAFAAGLRLTPRGSAEAARLMLPPTDELDWTIRHRQDRPRGTFHLRALSEAKSLGEQLQIVRRSLVPRRAWIVSQHPWARGPLGVAAAYGVHLARAPVWAARAWRFSRRARRAGRAR